MQFIRNYGSHALLFASSLAMGLVASPLPDLIDLPLGVLVFLPLLALGLYPPSLRSAWTPAFLGLVAAILMVQPASFSLAMIPTGAAFLAALIGWTREHKPRSPDPMAIIALGLVSASFVPAARFYQSVLSLQGPHDVDIFAIFGSSLAVAVVILATLALLSGRYREKDLASLSTVSGALWFPAPTSGIIPLVIAFSVLNAASAWLSPGGAFGAQEGIQSSSIIATAVWPFVRIAVVFVTFLAFTAIFNPSKGMKAGWARALELSGDDPGDAEPLLHRARRRAMWVTLVYLLVLTGIYEWAGELAAALGTIAVSFATAIVYDIRSEMRYREAQGFYVTIFEPEALWQVPHVRAALEGAGIPVFVRGWGLRTMLRILGSWGDLEVMIPGENLDEAEQIVLGLGLRPAYDHREDEEEGHDREDEHSAESEEQ